MSEVRVKRMIREMQCDPVTRLFESLLGLAGNGAASAVRPSRARVAAVPGIQAEEGDSLLLGGGVEK